MILKKIFAFLLSVVMLISCSTTALAVELDNEKSVSYEQNRIAEVTELRENNSDTYLLSDGTYECVVYSEDKYFQDESGEYQTINNSIIPVEYKELSNTYHYANKANSMRAYFSALNPSVLISSEKHNLAFSLVDARTNKAQIGEKGNSYKFSGFDLSSDNCITYQGVFNDTDVVYSVNSGFVKEYIVLNSPNAPTSFKFKFDTKDCYIKENEEGTLDIYNSSDEKIFELGDLFAVDSAESYTDKLKYEITDVSRDTTVVEVFIDEDYLNDSDRKYPVLIDPSVMVTGDLKTYDTYVSSRYPNSNYYVSDWLRTGRDTDFYVRRTYIKFDIPSSVTKYISSALLYIRKYSGATPEIHAYRVTSNWNSSEVTWNNKPGYSTQYGSSGATLKSNNWFALDVSHLVTLWKKGTYSNYGFLIKGIKESDTSQWTTFYSSDAASPNKPELRIKYASLDTTLMAYRQERSNGTIIERNGYFTPVLSYVNKYRKGSTCTSFYTSYTRANMIKKLQSSLIFFIHTHGMQSGFLIGNNNYLTISDLKGTDLSNLRCVLLLTCYTGVGGYSYTRVKNNTPANIVEQMVICGARTVIGFNEVTYVSDCNKFAEKFARRTMSEGKSVYNAVRGMDCTGFESDMSKTAIIGGSNSQTLNW